MQIAIMSTSVLIADDHVVVRRGLRALFESEPDITVVGEACDGLETLDLVSASCGPTSWSSTWCCPTSRG